MNILIAPNSMKGSLSAFDFADIAEEVFLSCSEEFITRKVPVADGGDLTGEVLCRALNAQKINMVVKDPLGRPVHSWYAISGETAIIEMAGASGIKLLKAGELDPMRASSYGTGQLLAAAMRRGCKEILLGIGGSATVDGGTGMLEALGFRLLGENNERLEGNGENLIRIKRTQTPDFIDKNVSIKIICDVDNPLNGPFGAARIFGPQKGVTEPMITDFENGLTHWAQILSSVCGEELASMKGAGAAGGIALPLIAFYNAKILSGAEFVLSLLNFDSDVKWSDLVITGEGQIDSQTLNKKAPKAVSDMAMRYNKPVIAIGGSVKPEGSPAFTGMFSILNEPMSLQEAIKETPVLLKAFMFELAKLLMALKKS